VSQLDWLLDDLVLRVPHIKQAVFLSQDGLALGATRGLDQADAEHLAALAAGFQSLARGAGRHFGGGEVRQTIIEMTSGFLFVTAAGQGTCLAVLTGAEADVGLVAYEMAVLVQRTGDHLQVTMRTPSALSTAGKKAAMPSNDERWLDAEAGPVVRPYALTRGRTRHSGDAFDLVATVTAMPGRMPDPGALGPEHISVLQLARSPTTVVDIASDVDLPLGVVRILLADLRELGLVAIRAPVSTKAQQVDTNTLREVLHGLRGL